jgi:hypothetical protein
MDRITEFNLPPPKNERDFERMCLALWRRLLKDPNAQSVGRKGQRQSGVDLVGRSDGTLHWVGVQCKVRTGGVLAQKDVAADVKRAKAFNPRLTELVFATTAGRDAKLQSYSRRLTENNIRSGHFAVTIFSWDDIETELAKESNLDLFKRFYGGAFVHYERRGIAISRIVSLSIGVGKETDTRYELLLGKTPLADNPNSYSGLDYWKGNYVICNWNDKRLDTFPIPTFASDLEHVFPMKRDAHIIAKWLSSLGSIDEVIYGDEEEHVMRISEKEFKEYLESLRE